MILRASRAGGRRGPFRDGQCIRKRRLRRGQCRGCRGAGCRGKGSEQVVRRQGKARHAPCARDRAVREHAVNARGGRSRERAVHICMHACMRGGNCVGREGKGRGGQVGGRAVGGTFRKGSAQGVAICEGRRQGEARQETAVTWPWAWRERAVKGGGGTPIGSARAVRCLCGKEG